MAVYRYKQVSKMKTQLRLSFITLAMIFLSACNIPGSVPTASEESADLTSVVQTVYTQITETARVALLSATPTFTPEPTETPTPLPPTFTPTEAFTETPIISPTDAPTATPTVDMPCNRANLESKSVGDGTVVFINRTFTQTFRLKNTGSCTWDQNYELRFVQGDLLNASAAIHLVPIGTVPTWGYANVDVLMKAPAEPGTYRGYWMIKAANGQIFGTGTSGATWFWVEIEVIDPDA